ncbi:MAG TPA: hypothetical protein VHS31_03790 [Tepidisphaeraceae bacterium]|jgi:hypothetical protein|nr:hypothetical protein [Tepidisphaeraceae bacterium]
MRVTKSGGKGRAVVLAALAVAGFSHYSQATTKTWIGGSSQWNISANWSPLGRPTLSSDMALLAQNSVVIYNQTSGPFDVGTVLIDSRLTLSQQTAGTQLNAGTILIGVSGAGTYTLGAGSVSVNNGFITLGQNAGGSGMFLLSASGALSAGSENIGGDGAGTFVQSGGQNSVTNLNIAGLYTLSAGSLTVACISGSGTFNQTGGTAAIAGSSINRINAFSMTNGTLDLSNHDLIVNTGSISTIGGYIKSAYGNGNWSSSGLTSTSARAVAGDINNPHKTALGYATASGINVGLFDGQSVSGSQVLVKYTWNGDANLDGVVNLLDLNAVASDFGAASRQWYQGDFNYDGTVNIADFNALAMNFGQVLPASDPPAEAVSPEELGALVPEPGLFGMLVGCFLHRLWHRRRICHCGGCPINAVSG